jgi:hypothetical protein
LYNAQQRGNDLLKRHNAAEQRRNVTTPTMWGQKCTMPTMVHCCRDSAVYHNQNPCSSKGVLHPCIPFHMPMQNFTLDVKLIVVDKNSSTMRKCEKTPERGNQNVKRLMHDVQLEDSKSRKSLQLQTRQASKTPSMDGIVLISLELHIPCLDTEIHVKLS